MVKEQVFLMLQLLHILLQTIELNVSISVFDLLLLNLVDLLLGDQILHVLEIFF